MFDTAEKWPNWNSENVKEQCRCIAIYSGGFDHVEQVFVFDQ